MRHPAFVASVADCRQLSASTWSHRRKGPPPVSAPASLPRIARGDHFAQDASLTLPEPVSSWIVAKGAQLIGKSIVGGVKRYESASPRCWRSKSRLSTPWRQWPSARTAARSLTLLGTVPGPKSRLTSALMGSLDNEPHTRLRYFCSPQHTRERTLFHDPKADDGFRRRPAANPDKMVFGPRGHLSTDLDFTCRTDLPRDDLTMMVLEVLNEPRQVASARPRWLRPRHRLTGGWLERCL